MGAGKWGDELCCEVNSYFLASFRIFLKYFRIYKISLGPIKNYKKKPNISNIQNISWHPSEYFKTSFFRSGLPEKMSGCFNLYIEFNR